MDTDDDCIKMTEGQVVGTVLAAYVTTGLFVAILGLTIWNTYHFLYAQGKWKVYPLCMFYVLSYADILLRLYHSFWMVEVMEYK